MKRISTKYEFKDSIESPLSAVSILLNIYNNSTRHQKHPYKTTIISPQINKNIPTRQQTHPNKRTITSRQDNNNIPTRQQ